MAKWTKELEATRFYRYYTDNGGLTDADWAELSPYFDFKETNNNNYLLRAGEVCHNTFFVESGLLNSFSLDEKGGEHIIQFLPENWIVSDRSSQYFNAPSSYFIKAIEPSVVVYMQREFLEKAVALRPAFACFQDSSLQRYIHIQQKRINSLLAMSAKDRYLSFIEMYPNLLLRIPQWMIASYLGITPESLSRVRRDMMNER